MKSLSQLEQCVDLITLDAQFQRACCGQSDYIKLNNGFGSSNGYDWIDNTACSASKYNVSNTQSVIAIFPYFHNHQYCTVVSYSTLLVPPY